MIEINNKLYECASKIPIDLIDDKWKFLIIWNLSNKSLNISDLSEKISGISKRTLSRKLKSLVQVYLIHRIVFPQTPPRIEYSLTMHGKRLVDIFETMRKWGEVYAKEVKKNTI